jgi:IS1 family transposase
MWHYVKSKKKKVWVWFAYDRVKKGVIDFVSGSRGIKTGKKLMNKLKDLNPISYASDAWKVYKKLINPKKHIISKKETTQVESHHANVRHYLARFKRKSKCYSKSIEMIELSLYLLIYRTSILNLL